MALLTPDGAEIATFDLRPDGRAPTLLFAHANGFHGRCYQPMADRLDHPSVAFDFRGFGDSTPPPDWPVDWRGYGVDVRAVAEHVVTRAGAAVIGVGHSMGGGALVMAALDDPPLFAGLVLYEPIVVPPNPDRTGPALGNPMAQGARRRRPAFASYEAAIANYSSKPPFDACDPEALDAYVRFGMRQGDDGQVHLKCTPEHEARTYEMGAEHSPFVRLGELRIPTLYLSGHVDRFEPSGFTAILAEHTPGAEYRRLDELGHFGPLEQPGTVADEVERFTRNLHA